MKKLLGIAIVTGLLSTGASAEKVVMKAGSAAPEGTPWAKWLGEVKKRMEAEAGGGLKVKMFLSSKLGGEKEMVEATKSGRLQLFGGSVGALASTYVPELNVFELPFIFSSDAEADFVMNEVRADVAKLLQKRGFEMVMWAENGWHGYASKKGCLNTPDKLVGMKMRSQESMIHIETYKAFGAAPVEMPVPEVLSSLQTGVVDGYSNTPLFSFATGWYNGIKTYSYTKHIYQPALIVVSKKWFDKQTPIIQKIVKSTNEEKRGFDLVRRLTKPLLENFTAAGVEVCTVTDADRKLFAAKVQPVWKKFAAQSAGNRAMLDAVKRAKAKFAKK